MQLGVGMTLPGLDKGLKGMCDTELRKIQVPWRLSRKKRGKGTFQFIHSYFSLKSCTLIDFH